MGEKPIQKEILQLFFTQSYLSVPNPTSRIHRSVTVSMIVLFLHSQSIYTSLTLIFAFEFKYPIIKSWEGNIRTEERRRLVCFGFIHNLILKCVIQYFDTFLFETFWELSFISLCKIRLLSGQTVDTSSTSSR